jgi:hypothetical protein
MRFASLVALTSGGVCGFLVAAMGPPTFLVDSPPPTKLPSTNTSPTILIGGIWRRKPLVARMALGGSATAPRLLSLSRTPSSPRSA